MKKNESGDRDGFDRAASLEQYLQMDETQKDAEIQKAVARLQKRIHEILYSIETELYRRHPSTKKKKND
jgi:hypothetical protein